MKLQPVIPMPQKSAYVIAMGTMLLTQQFAFSTPPEFQVKNDRVELVGVGPGNPVIYDNDWWRDVPDAAYLWVKASIGEAELKGNIVSRDMWGWEKGYQYKLADGIKDAESLFEAAEKSGLKYIPRPIAGADAALIRPESGKIEETVFTRSAGSDLIAREARNASRTRPLLVFAGGPCTTVATAYLSDPSIADRLIVFQVDGGAYNGKDSWSWEIASRQLRFANWARGYFWGDWSRWHPERFHQLPRNPLNDVLRNYASSDLGKANQWGDGVWIFTLFEPRCVAKVVEYEHIGITIPKDGINTQNIEDEFFATMSDAKAFQQK